MPTIIIRNRLSGRRYEVEVDPTHTVKDVIDVLIEGGYIQPAPYEGWEWRLMDSSGFMLPPDARIVDWISGSGEDTFWLFAHYAGGERDGHPPIG